MEALGEEFAMEEELKEEEGAVPRLVLCSFVWLMRIVISKESPHLIHLF